MKKIIGWIIYGPTALIILTLQFLESCVDEALKDWEPEDTEC